MSFLILRYECLVRRLTACSWARLLCFCCLLMTVHATRSVAVAPTHIPVCEAMATALGCRDTNSSVAYSPKCARSTVATSIAHRHRILQT